MKIDWNIGILDDVAKSFGPKIRDSIGRKAPKIGFACENLNT